MLPIRRLRLIRPFRLPTARLRLLTRLLRAPLRLLRAPLRLLTLLLLLPLVPLRLPLRLPQCNLRLMARLSNWARGAYLARLFRLAPRRFRLATDGV